MQIFSSLSKKQFILLGSLFILLAIPLTLYLARNPQIFKGRAIIGSSVIFVGLSGNPPITSSQNVTLKLAYNQSYGSNTTAPVTPAPVTSGPTLSVTPTQVASGGKVTVSWTGVNATDNGWFIDSPNYPTGQVYLSSCTSPSAAATVSPAATQAPSNITFTASPAQVAVGENITLSWTGVNATDVNWAIWQNTGGAYMYLGTCSVTPISSLSYFPTIGSCSNIVAPSTTYPFGTSPDYNTLYFYLIHVNKINGNWDSYTTSNVVTIINAVKITPTPAPYTPPPATPTPTEAPGCGFGMRECFELGLTYCVVFWQGCDVR